MRIGLIGPEGFIGSYVTQDLIDHGHEVVGIKHGAAKSDVWLDAVVDCNGDSRRFWAGEQPLASFDRSVRSVAESLVSLRYGTYVYLSSVDVYGRRRAERTHNHEDASIELDGMEVYGFHKWLAESLVRYHAPAHLILRLGTVIGPGLRKNPIHDAMIGAPIRQTAQSTLTLIDLGHVARILRRLLTQSATGTYNVTGCASITIRGVLEAVAAARGISVDGFQSHSERIETQYDISVDKACVVMELPNSERVLTDFLSAAPVVQ